MVSVFLASSYCDTKIREKLFDVLFFTSSLVFNLVLALQNVCVFWRDTMYSS